MAKVMFTVVAIHPDRSTDYFDFWVRNKQSNDQGEELHPAMLSTTDMFEAHNKKEAEAMARKKYPGHTIDSAATERHG